MKAHHKDVRLRGVTLMLAAAPGIVGSAHYRTAPPMPPGEIEIFVIGCVAILALGAIVMIVWSRFSKRTPKISPSSGNAKP